MVTRELSRHETSIMKGIAILCIALHNFLHYLPPFTGENEFKFCPEYIWNFLNLLTSQPFDLINTLFSFLGHYGVQAFILLSGYGLAKSMQTHRQEWLPFMASRMKKLVPLLLIGIALFIAYTYIWGHRCLYMTEASSLFYKSLLIHTILPNEGLSLIGPWWFFGLIFQLYILFPFLFSSIEKHGIKALVLISSMSISLIYIEQYGLTSTEYITIMQNAPAHLSEFSLGIWFALNNGAKVPKATLPLSIAIFILGNFFKPFFPFTFISISIIILWAAMSTNIGNNKLKPLSFIGSISMLMFVTNGFLRQPFLDMADSHKTLSVYMATLLFLATIVAISFVTKYPYDWLTKAFGKILNKIRSIKPVSENIKTISLSLKLALCAVAAYFTIFYLTLSESTFDKQSLSMEQTELTINENNDYTPLIKYQTLANNYIKLDVDINFDILENDGQKPVIVFEIGNFFWNKAEINGTDKISVHKKLVISHSTKGQTLKIYMWNNCGGMLEISNLDINIVGTKSL